MCEARKRVFIRKNIYRPR